MDKHFVTQRSRERLDAGTLPRVIPPLTTEPGRPSSPVGTITQIPRPMPPDLGNGVSEVSTVRIPLGPPSEFR